MTHGSANGPSAKVSRGDGTLGVALAGRVTVENVERLRRELREVRDDGAVTVDLSGVQALDTAGAWLVTRLGPASRVSITGASDAQARLIEAVRANAIEPEEKQAKRPGLRHRLDRVGRATAGGILAVLDVVGFLGLTLSRLGRLLLRPWRLRLTPLVHHMQSTGFDAIPIVALMAFLIGVVLAFQGAVQLRQFGAEVFVVELIAISVLRELGILLTAIIVAGRTGAAFTSSIGSMKMREEIDAMRTLGLDPIEVLVVPRVLALLITLPILGFIADMAGLFGGALMAWIELGISPGTFRTRLDETVSVWNYAIGLIKAPVFALIIGIVGCHQGFAVEGNAELLGRLTSRSVVISIFMVIVADAMFSIFFARIGL